MAHGDFGYRQCNIRNAALPKHLEESVEGAGLFGLRKARAPTDNVPASEEARLTEEQIAFIKEQEEAGVSVEEIARETGLDRKIAERYW
jgi:hypothetical protein